MSDCESLEVLFPVCGTGELVALRVYMDASIRGREIISVSGFAFGLENAKKASAEWNRLFDGKVCHMTDLHGRHNDFKDITPQEGGELLKGAVKIINKYSSYGVSASCDISQIANLLPAQSSDDHKSRQLIKGFSNPYALCCHFAMSIMGAMSKRNEKSNISYVFEMGDDGQGAVKAYTDFILSLGANSVRERLNANSIAFAEKTSIHSLLQTADVLAWEWTKHVERKRDGKSARPSFRALFNSDLLECPMKYGFSAKNEAKSMSCSHFEGENLHLLLGHFCKFFEASDTNNKVEAVKDFLSWKAATDTMVY